MEAADTNAADAAEDTPVQPQNRKYLGSKYRLLDFITETILTRTGGIEVFVDPFAGTGVVAAGFRRYAVKIIANDLLYSNYVANRAFLTSTPAEVDLDRVGDLLEELNALSPVRGYVFASYGGSYFTPENAAKIDAVREAIASYRRAGRCSEQEGYLLLTSLLLAADKAANTVGQYDAFLKHLDARSDGRPEGPDQERCGRHLVDGNVRKPLHLRLPAVELEGNGGNEVYNEDANQLLRRLAADVLYLDPPYNSRQYIDCYHVLENIMRWDKPKLYGKTRKFRREQLKSRYSRKNQAAGALAELVQAARARHIYLSYNSEGLISDAEIEEILASRGPVEVLEKPYPVFGNGAGSSRKRVISERIFYCRVSRPGAFSGRKIELFTAGGQSRGYYSPRNRLNDLTGKEWVYWSKSVINKPYPPNLQHRLRSRHGGQKPPDLCGDLIEVFTKRGQRVLDPFAGVGGTLLGASLRGRKAVGIELNPQWVEIYRRVCALEKIPEQTMICGDSRSELVRLAEQEAERDRAFDLILTDVPYWRMDRARRSRGKFKRVGEPQRERRLSKLAAFNDGSYQSKEQWLGQLQEVFQASIRLLKPKGYLVVFIGDMYHSGRYHFLSADLSAALSALGLTLKGNLIWYDVSKSLHVYGYQYEYIPSLIHQSILVFRKEQ